MKFVSKFIKYLDNSRNSRKALIINASDNNSKSVSETESQLKSLGYQVFVEENDKNKEKFDLIIEIK